MKKQVISYLFLVMVSLHAFAQNQNIPTIDSKSYEKMKQEGKLPLNTVFNQAGSFTPSLEDIKKAFSKKGGGDKDGPETTCGCYVAPDNTYTLAMGPNDDGSTALLNIPFNFCLYGTNYTNLYINNNGNISFGTSYGTFSSSPFPSSSYVMVAPFWGDVDTRGIGTVKYKITPTAMYINWDNVGYYNSATDKVNTFQLIITDGTDPVLPNGNNIAFCYGDMQWTTGAASGGIGGFGGTPATVGANKGDGVNFIQLGRFDQPGAAYDGPFGANDGVSWLDNQSFYFNVCGTTNTPPIANFIPNVGGSGCDSISICGLNDTLLINAMFLSPENGQTTTININFNGSPGFTTLNNTPGNPATALIQVISSPANAGMNTITFTATDNGTPAGVTVVNYNVFVDTNGLANFNPVINGNLEFCEGQNTTLTVSPTTYDSYLWNNGSTGNSIVADSTGQYWVTANWNGCSKSVVVDVVEHPAPAPVIQGALFTCTSNPTTLYIVDSTGLYTSIVWSNSSTNDSITVLSGTYTVTVTDTNGCVGTSPAVTVVNSTPTVTITGGTSFCAGSNHTLTAVPSITSGASYLWSNGGTNASTTINTSGTYYVTVNYNNGCSASDTIQVTVINPVTSSQNPSICQGDNFTLPGGQVVTQSGTYLDTLVAASGCDSIITTSLTVIPLVDATISSVGNLCENSAIINLSAATSGGIWSGNGIVNATTGEFNSSQAGVGSHQIIYSVGTMCGNADTINITINPVPDFSLASLEDTCLSSRGTIISTIISGTPVYTYSWSRGDNSQHLTNVLAGNYSLVVTDGNGCSKSEHIVVGNIGDVCAVVIPNIITPNGDNMNDNFVITNLEFFPKNNLVVFNRWGKKIYEKTGYQNDWNGDGHSDGTYFFILELNDFANTIHKGTITILR